MAPSLSLYSQMSTVLLASRAPLLCTSSMSRVRPGELRQYSEQPNRKALLLSLGQPCPRYTKSCGKNQRDLDRRWKSSTRKRKKDLSSIHAGHETRLKAFMRHDTRSQAHKDRRSSKSWTAMDDLALLRYEERLYEDNITPKKTDTTQFPVKDYRTLKKKDAPRSPVKDRIDPQFFQPHIYHSQPSTWEPCDNNAGTLRQGHILKIASWNLNSTSPASRATARPRTSAALTYLKTMFGQEPHDLVVMLQGLRHGSLEAILHDKWTQQNFILSDVKPPDRPTNTQDNRMNDRLKFSHFSLVMASRTLPISNVFRMPLISSIGRQALVVDFPLSGDQIPEQEKKLLRLCTAHFGGTCKPEKYRSRQIAGISALLKGKPSQGIVRAGLAGGAMDGDSPDLKDVWEDQPAQKPPSLTGSEEDTTYGQAKGHTSGYQSAEGKEKGRWGRFIYTGSIETLAVDEAQDITGKLGRFGIGLKTKLENEWVSDHFGITVGIRVI